MLSGRSNIAKARIDDRYVVSNSFNLGAFAFPRDYVAFSVCHSSCSPVLYSRSIRLSLIMNVSRVSRMCFLKAVMPVAVTRKVVSIPVTPSFYSSVTSLRALHFLNCSSKSAG